MTDTFHRREILALGISLTLCGLTLAGPPNVREVKPAVNVQDRGVYEEFPETINDDFWVLEFRFKDLRLIETNVPGRGKKTCWYLWYQVVNKTGKPRNFNPQFDLVTRERNVAYRDQYLPLVHKTILQAEDPKNYLDIKNSASIAHNPIPPSSGKKDAVPVAVTGVAIWDNVDPDSNQYDIYITGLSNGYKQIDPDTVQWKTLRLTFKRLGDRYEMKSSEIHFQAPATWIYRTVKLTAPGPEKEPMKGEK